MPATRRSAATTKPSPAKALPVKKVRVAETEVNDTPSKKARVAKSEDTPKKRTSAKVDKAMDAAGQPKKRLASPSAAQRQARETEEEVSDSPAPAPAPKKAAPAKANGKKRAREEDEEANEMSKIIKGLGDVSRSDDDADSSDEEEEEEDAKVSRNAPIMAVKLPSSKDDKTVRQRLEKVAKRKQATKSTEVPATLYVGRLPHGFFEDQLRKYFEQFGDVKRLRLSRNRKTGKPKHFAFIEFADKDVAAIVQETMNNYLIDGHLLQVREVPKEKIHPKLWIGANAKFRAVPTDRIERVRRSKPKTPEAQEASKDKLLKSQDKRRQRIKDAGIDYEFAGYKA